MAMAVLDAIVLPFDRQPLGLDRTCVEQHAGLNGKIYVDVRFGPGVQPEANAEPICERHEFVLRFDSKNFVPSLTSEVVRLQISRKDAQTMEFQAVTEDRLWPQRQARNIYSLSPCYSSRGHLSRGPTGWQAAPATRAAVGPSR
jgi:hypothetical protein